MHLSLHVSKGTLWELPWPNCLPYLTFDYTFHRGNSLPDMSNEKHQPCLQRRVFSEWVEDLWSQPGRYTLQKPSNSWKTEQSLSDPPDFPTFCVYLNLSHSNDITEYSLLQQGSALIHRWCGWSELLESSVCLWQKVRPAPEITAFSLCNYGKRFRSFYEKIDKVTILWAVFVTNNLDRRWWTTFKTEEKPPKINSFRVIPAHQLSSCDMGGDPGVRGLRQCTGALFTPRAKMTNSINSRHLSRAPMDPKHTWQAAEGLLPSRPDIRCWHSISISWWPQNNFPSH